MILSENGDKSTIFLNVLNRFLLQIHFYLIYHTVLRQQHNIVNVQSLIFCFVKSHKANAIKKVLLSLINWLILSWTFHLIIGEEYITKIKIMKTLVVVTHVSWFFLTSFLKGEDSILKKPFKNSNNLPNFRDLNKSKVESVKKA